MLSRERAAELGIDAHLAEQALRQWQQQPQLREQAMALFSEDDNFSAEDVELDLYGGFIGDADRASMALVHSMSPQELADQPPHFHDQRLNELLFRVRARTWPETLSADEQQRWQLLRSNRLTAANSVARDFQSFADELEQLVEANADNPQRLEILKACYQWAQYLATG